MCLVFWYMLRDWEVGVRHFKITVLSQNIVYQLLSDMVQS